MSQAIRQLAEEIRRVGRQARKPLRVGVVGSVSSGKVNVSDGPQAVPVMAGYAPLVGDRVVWVPNDGDPFAVGSLGGSVAPGTAVVAVAESFTTNVGGTYTNIGSAITFTPPDRWGDYDLTVSIAARVTIPGSVGGQILMRAEIDADDQVATSWLGANPIAGGNRQQSILTMATKAGLSGAVDVQMQAQVLALTTGTALDFGRIDGYLTGTRVT